MIYFANPVTGSRPHMQAKTFGYIDTPLQGNKRPPGVMWCADNGCFNDQRFTIERWWKWLQKNADDIDLCYFATAPDVVGDHEATLERSRHNDPAKFAAQARFAERFSREAQVWPLSHRC